MPTVEWDGQPYAHAPERQPARAGVARAWSARCSARAWSSRARYARANGAQPRSSARDRDAWLGHRRRRQDLLRPARRRCASSASTSAGARARRHPAPEARHALPARAGRSCASSPRGLDEILVVEEKRPFLETLVQGRALRRRRARRASSASATSRARRCVPRERRARRRPDRARRRRAPRARACGSTSVEARLRGSSPSVARAAARALPLARARRSSARAARTTRSTVRARRHARRRRHRLPHDGAAQPGGQGRRSPASRRWAARARSGSAWRRSPTTPHLVQNLGDGTFFHSGSLAIRAAVAAGVNITFKLLYNGAVAMTGGQDVEGAAERARAHALARARGRQADHRHHRRARALPRRRAARRSPRCATATSCCEAQQRARARSTGVTVLIHDQECAAEKRRLRKRGKARRARRSACSINERVCEGCGDCGEKSNCLSVQPVETEFGRKTQIHQASCNKDYSCLEGDCPSFLTVDAAATQAKHERAARSPRRAARAARCASPRDDFACGMIGIGGTGVVTVSQILGMAALLDGQHVARPRPDRALRRRAARWSPTCASPRDADRRLEQGVGRRAPTCYLGFDLLGAAEPEEPARRRPASAPSRSSPPAPVPTGAMVIDTDVRFPALGGALRRDRRAPPARERQRLPRRAGARRARCSATTCRPTCSLLGAAYQRGAAAGVAPRRSSRRSSSTAPRSRRTSPRFRWGRAVRRRAGRGRGRHARARGAPRRRELTDARRARWSTSRRRRPRRAAPAARGPRARAVAYQDARLRARATPTSSRRVHAAEQERTPGARRADRGGRPPACTS